MAWLTGELFLSAPNEVSPGGLPHTGIQRVLVCRPNHRLGNTVLTTPLIAELERRYPGAEVDVLSAGPAASCVYSGYTGMGEIYALDRRAVRHPWATWRTLRALRTKRYDLVIDAASGSSSGRLVTAMVRARFRISVGSTASGTPMHLAARPVHALRLALGVPTGAAVPSLDLRLSEAERRSGRAALGRVLKVHATNDARVLAIFPNATGAKRYDQTWWTTFLTELDRAAGPFRVVELVAADGTSRVGNLYPTYFTSDPRKLASLIDAAGLYVSADCGVMHLAAATKAQTIGLFAKTDPSRYAPYGPGNTAFWTGDDGAATVAHRVAEHILHQRHSD
ncbi:glycosyltransferase family 9 protein [Luteibacter sp. Lutesp34]|uniref:glycosyltransferase family 9 protein n=1 Tax=Luteibacter sp. Lutesp34 TaxID=3243030 RepID=UPI0039B458C5